MAKKKSVRRKKEAGKAGIKKSKVLPYTTPPPDRPPPAENMLYLNIMSLRASVLLAVVVWKLGSARRTAPSFATAMEEAHRVVVTRRSNGYH